MFLSMKAYLKLEWQPVPNYKADGLWKTMRLSAKEHGYKSALVFGFVRCRCFPDDLVHRRLAQVIKEAMACGCPIVSVDVGDVKERVEGLEGCYVAETRDPQELVQLLQKAMTLKGKTKGRERLVADGLDNNIVAQKLISIYERVIKK